MGELPGDFGIRLASATVNTILGLISVVIGFSLGAFVGGAIGAGLWVTIAVDIQDANGGHRDG